MELKVKSINAAYWSFVESAVNIFFTFLSGVTLARLLDPNDFGLIGMLSILIAISNGLILSGFFTALVRKHDATEDDYNTVFLFNIGMSILVYLGLYIFAPLIGQYYNQPQLIKITRVLGLIFLINGIGIIQSVLITKQVNFRTQAKITFISASLSTVVAIYLAVKGFGVWSLVWQQIFKQLINTTLLWLFGTWRPLFFFSLKSFNELFRFGSKMFIANTIDNFFGNIFQVIIGKYHSPAMLGQYVKADQFSTLISTNLTSIINRVSFPILANIQDDKLKFSYAFKKILNLAVILISVAMFCLFSISEPLIIFLIGEKWIPAIPLMKLLCLIGISLPINLLNLSVLQIYGKGTLYLNLELLRKIFLIPAIIVGIFGSIFWMLFVAFVLNILSMLINIYFVQQQTGYKLKNQVKDILPHLLIPCAAAIATLSLLEMELNTILQLLLQIAFYLVITGLSYRLFRKTDYSEIKSVIFDRFRRFKKVKL